MLSGGSFTLGRLQRPPGELVLALVALATQALVRLRRGADEKEGLGVGWLLGLGIYVEDDLLDRRLEDALALATKLAADAQTDFKGALQHGDSGSSADVGTVQRGVLDAGIEFLPKPFTRSTLLERVREILDSR